MSEAVLEAPPQSAEKSVPTAVSIASLPAARISVAQYHRMVECGALTEEDRVELLDGMLVKKMAKGPKHELIAGLLEDQIRPLLESGHFLGVETPIELETSEPEPDLAVIRGDRRDFAERHPGGSDCLLLIEVADTSLTKDRLKAALYAAGGVPEYWIVDLAGRTIITHRNQTPDGYQDVSENATAKADLPCGKLSVSVNDLLGEPVH